MSRAEHLCVALSLLVILILRSFLRKEIAADASCFGLCGQRERERDEAREREGEREGDRERERERGRGRGGESERKRERSRRWIEPILFFFVNTHTSGGN